MEVYNINFNDIVQSIFESLSASQEKIEDLENDMNNVMPKTGGSFTGNVVAAYTATAGDVLRNVAVRDASNNLVSTMGLSMVRK